MELKEKYNLWLNNVKDEALLNELKNMTDEEISTAFFKDMEFGTAGLRGIVGAGSNCMNIYTVGLATRAVCKYLKKKGGKSIAISYDSRNMSKEFAELVACICAKHGIKSYLVKEMMSTPFLSFLVRYYHTDMGVMITASHNPKEYNGYKVYGKDGCQLLDEPSLEIMKIASGLDLFDLESEDFDKAVQEKKIIFADIEALETYKAEVREQSRTEIENVTVVYSALNGTGINTLPDVLKDCGAKIVYNEVQCKPDKNFTTCPYPNPEKIEVFETSLPLAKEAHADIIILSDPDADRVGIEVLHKGEYVHLTGNEVGALLTDYLMKTRPVENGIIVKSIVSSNLAKKIAEFYGGTCKNVLTGFKYIGEFITELEENFQEDEFVLGFEESYGYLIGTHVRDKDATVASLVITEMVSEYKKKKKTLIDRLEELYFQFGRFEHNVYSYKFAGSAGAEKMEEILNSFRNSLPEEIGGLKVVGTKDYLEGVDDLPKSNVLAFELENGGELIVRPSGTEPLIKVYITLSETKEKNEKNLENIKNFLTEKMK